MKQEDIQLQEWMNVIDDFLILIDNNGTIVRVNQAWIDFCTENEVRESLWTVGTSYFEQLKEREKHHEIQAIQRILDNERTEHKQLYPFLLKNGEIQWLSVKIQGIKLFSTNSRGAIIYHKPASIDEIEPITAESVLESMTDGFALLNDHYQFQYINEIAERMYQMKREDVVGRSLFDVFPHIIGSSFHLAYQQAMEERKVIEVADYFESLNIWFQVKAFPLKKGGLAVYFQDVSKQRKIEEKLSESTHYDYLTELPNRRLLTVKGNTLIAQKKKFTLFYLNVDNLKLINAMYSHDVGDAVLKTIAERLRSLKTARFEVGRLDSDEFAVIYEPKKDERLQGIAQKITGIFEPAFLVPDLPALYIHVSIGISCYPNDAQQFSDIVSRAETAMYEAKKSHGSSFVFFRPAMHTLRTRRSTIEEGLSGNLNNIGLYYMLQPQINGSDGKLVGVEVLARWNHPELGEVSPLEFIEVAEAIDTIAPLTLYLVENIFIQMKEWKQRFDWNIRTAINMTPSLLANFDFFVRFFELKKQYDIPSTMIEIEITEQAELTYSEKTLKNLHLCRSKGISIAIDDFGTGFSMISYLTHLPITKIKIDRSFVQKIGQDKKSDAVLKSIIQLAKSIECELVAEGVERSEEVEFLQAIHCNVFQGYLYDRPLRVQDFEMKYLQTNKRFQTD